MQTMTVADVCGTSAMRALVVPQDTPLAVAIGHFSQDHDLRGIFLVDEQERLAGVVNKQDLLDWLRLQLAMPALAKPPSLVQMRRVVMARTVGDLARKDSVETAVTLADSLAEALQKMASHNLNDIPVVDENGRIINDLRLSEALACVLNFASDGEQVTNPKED